MLIQKKLKQQRGFSLIELLFVIAIIFILALISIIALNGQRAKARDAKRISDIRQISTALEFYYLDEGEYPWYENIIIGLSDRDKLCPKDVGGFVASNTECNAYMSKIPTDPLPNRKYFYSGSDKGYDITFITEKESTLGPAGTYHAHSETINSVPGIK